MSTNLSFHWSTMTYLHECMSRRDLHWNGQGMGVKRMRWKRGARTGFTYDVKNSPEKSEIDGRDSLDIKQSSGFLKNLYCELICICIFVCMCVLCSKYHVLNPELRGKQKWRSVTNNPCFLGTYYLMRYLRMWTNNI